MEYGTSLTFYYTELYFMLGFEIGVLLYTENQSRKMSEMC